MPIKLLHSFEIQDNKFEKYCRLTFEINGLKNTYVDNLTEVKNICEYDVIIIHFLRSEDCLFLLNNKIEIPIIWFCWGGDIFDQGKFHNYFLLKKTKRLRRKFFFRQGFFKGIKQIIKEIFPILSEYSKVPRMKILALSQIDFIVPVMPGDYLLIKENYATNLKLHHLNYVNPLVEEDTLEGITGSNILLGNSASFTNNHIEAIDLLSKFELGERKIIIPLSYGNKDLSNYIENYAKRKLGDENIVILKDFISFHDYNKILNSCEVVIMNHLRQEAVGNIVQTLLNGGHLYLREDSTVYHYLHENGFKVSLFHESIVINGLSTEDILINRSKAREIFGAKTQHDKLNTLLAKVLD